MVGGSIEVPEQGAVDHGALCIRDGTKVRSRRVVCAMR